MQELQRKKSKKVSYTEVKRVAEELSDIGICDFEVEPKNEKPVKDPNIIYKNEAVFIKESLEKYAYDRYLYAKQIIGNKKLTSASIAIISTCLKPYQLEFLEWAIYRVSDHKNFIKRVSSILNYSHYYDKLLNHYNMLLDIGYFENESGIDSQPIKSEELDATPNSAIKRMISFVKDYLSKLFSGFLFFYSIIITILYFLFSV